MYLSNKCILELTMFAFPVVFEIIPNLCSNNLDDKPLSMNATCFLVIKLTQLPHFASPDVRVGV